MLRTSISDYANRNGILTRLVSPCFCYCLLLPEMSFVQSSVEFERQCEFSKLRDERTTMPKINKSPTVSNGISALSFEIWTANLAQLLTVGTLTNPQSFIFGDSNWQFCKVGYPVGTQKPDIQMRTFLTWDFFKDFWVKKIKTCWIYKHTVFAYWEKYEVSWNFCLAFIIYF